MCKYSCQVDMTDDTAMTAQYRASVSLFLYCPGLSLWHVSSQRCQRLPKIGSDKSQIGHIWTFQLSLSTFLLTKAKFTGPILKKSHICPFQGQSDPFWMRN